MTTGIPLPNTCCKAAPPIVTEADALVQVRVSQFHMGMMVHLTVWARTVKEGNRAAARTFARIAELNQIFSDYEPASELSRLWRQAGEGPVRVSQELWQVLSTAKRISQVSEGLYDPTIRPLSQLWREARRTETLPSTEQISSTLRLVGHENMLLDAKARTVELMQPGMQLDLGGIAKGFVGDEAIRLLKKLGYTRAAYEAGGDKVFGDPPPGQEGWQVTVPSEEKLSKRLANCAVSLSGATEQYLEVKDIRYSHVIDPRTGRGVTVHSRCLTVAEQGLIADPLATLGTIMPEEQYAAIMEQHFPEVRYEIFPTPVDQEKTTPRIPPPE